MSGWICQREGCGHNKSQHSYEWNKFRGVWDTACQSKMWGRAGREACRCPAFLDEDDADALVEAPNAADVEARQHMVCSCGHHVDEHHRPQSGQAHGVFHVSTHGYFLTCGCREYDGQEEVEPGSDCSR